MVIISDSDNNYCKEKLDADHSRVKGLWVLHGSLMEQKNFPFLYVRKLTIYMCTLFISIMTLDTTHQAKLWH